jgi:hypothetical protein
VYDPRFVLDTFDTLPSDQKIAILYALLDALVLADTLYFLANPRCPGVYEAGLQYQAEEIGHDDWRDVPSVLSFKGGDCFPKNTMLLVRDGASGSKLVPIQHAEVGMQIWGLDDWTTLEAVQRKGRLVVETLRLSNHSTVPLTADHHVFVLSPDSKGPKRVRVLDLCGGEILTAPRQASSEWPGSRKRSNRREDGLLVSNPTITRIDRNSYEVECFDIQTADHYVYLPEHDVTVSNCEDLACYRVAELRVRTGEPAKPRVTSRIIPSPKYGNFTLYHITVLRADGSVEDPSAILGMPT